MSQSVGNIMPLREIYGAASMNNDECSYLWVESAAQFIPRLNELVTRVSDEFTIIEDMKPFKNDEEDVLGKLFEHHLSDKSTTHNYYVFYSYILNKLGKDKELDVLEIGLGTNNPNLVSSMGEYGRPGASVYAFRDYLPNANIYGADVDREILFETDRIKTAYVDQMNPSTFGKMIEDLGNSKYDVIIDDGLHSTVANFNTLLFGLDHIKNDGWFIVEDIGEGMVDNWRSIDFIMKRMNGYKTFMIKTTGGYYHHNISYMYIVHKDKE